MSGGQATDGDRASVLVCDDEPQILRALKVILREEGFEAIGAESAREALEADPGVGYRIAL
ncbi:MAG TPA: hypothetical protein VGH58_02755 [Solirubrobacterales bacterium]